MEEKVSDKIKRHVPWEIFWQSIPIILISIFLALAGIFIIGVHLLDYYQL